MVVASLGWSKEPTGMTGGHQLLVRDQRIRIEAAGGALKLAILQSHAGQV